MAARRDSVSRLAITSIPVASSIEPAKLTLCHGEEKSSSPEYPTACAAARTASSRRRASSS